MVFVTSSDMLLAEPAISARKVHLTVTGRFASIDVDKYCDVLRKTFIYEIYIDLNKTRSTNDRDD